MAKYIQNSLES